MGDRSGQCGLELRPIPFPYKAMLAICSDLDETPDRTAYWETSRFLNTTAATSMGDGVGLEVGNTIYFDMPQDQFAYWNTDDHGRAMIRAMIRSGHIDCLHSYGDLATKRADAARALDDLAKHDCRLEVWIDHAVAPSNLGADIMRGFGDLPGSEVYHADLTCRQGMRYVWRGRVTSITGQDVAPRFRGILDGRRLIQSSKTLAKEAAKRGLALAGQRKYAMHASNEVLRSTQLRDGQNVLEFLRCNPSWGGVSRHETADGLGHVLTEAFLERLVARRGLCVLYTHLGKSADRSQPLPKHSCLALRRLAERQRQGDILVTTTRRLLGFAHAMRVVTGTMTHNEGKNRIDLFCRHDTDFRNAPAVTESDLAGLTVYADDSEDWKVYFDGVKPLQVSVNEADETGRRSLSIDWPRLTFPDV